MIARAISHLTDSDFRFIRELVYNHCGIALDDGKRFLVQARLARQIREMQFNSVREYIDYVMADETGEQITELINALSTNLTGFFRENQHFRYIADSFVPSLVQRSGGKKRLRAWSAACSTGEEPYSLAITLLESLAAAEKVAPVPPTSLQGPAGWDVRILATDISTRVLEVAQSGRYASDRMNSVPPSYRAAYFSRQGPTEFAVCPLLSRISRFRHLNLIDSWPFRGPFDIILCRNVMIYFDTATQQRLVNRFWDCLTDGGLLFTGHSESLTGISHRFQSLQPTIYTKVVN